MGRLKRNGVADQCSPQRIRYAWAGQNYSTGLCIFLTHSLVSRGKLMQSFHPSRRASQSAEYLRFLQLLITLSNPFPSPSLLCCGTRLSSFFKSGLLRFNFIYSKNLPQVWCILTSVYSHVALSKSPSIVNFLCLLLVLGK